MPNPHVNSGPSQPQTLAESSSVLLSFTGFRDPYFPGLIDQSEQPGPILSLLSARSFDRIYLFSTPNTVSHTLETQQAIAKAFPQVVVEIKDLPLTDPTDYSSILIGLREHIKSIQDVCANAAFFVAVSSGTPQMHACWVLLAAAGEIPARLLHIRRPHFVSKERPLVSEINLSSKEFPEVRAPIITSPKVEDADEYEEAVCSLGIVGDSKQIRQALETAATLAPASAPILILGETGTGKEMIARFIHRLSKRPQDLFVAVNCAAIPEELVESLLFGHKRGAFSGAITDQEGKFFLANGGTLFLDELGELPQKAQAKLLRVLEDGMLEPVGGKRPVKIDVRVIAATNANLRRQVRQGKFRDDLYYRLNVGVIDLPPLRDRRGDIPKLSLFILDKLNASLRHPKRLSPEALSRLQNHNWPGNIRDLENAIERSARLCRSEVLMADDLIITEPVSVDDPLECLPTPSEGFSMEEFLGSVRKQLILRALEATQGNQTKAARMLAITPQAVHKFLQQGLKKST